MKKPTRRDARLAVAAASAEAPTMLKLLGLPQPAEMTGLSIVELA